MRETVSIGVLLIFLAITGGQGPQDTGPRTCSVSLGSSLLDGCH
ncbi:MAG: hypothetical protein RLZZ528_1351 [Pseudomonadota bacterium]|jgi:hypothetical protein